MPEGGVLTTGSGLSGVGGSSGSGTSTSGSTPRFLVATRPVMTLSSSSSTSGAGGGSGRGGRTGLLGPRRRGGEPKILPPLLGGKEGGSRPRVPDRRSNWERMALARPPVLSGVVGRDAAWGVSGEERRRLGWLSRRRRISGLWRSMLARVGEAKDGLVGEEPRRRGASWMEAEGCSSGWTATAVRGEVLRRLGAEVSMEVN
jgi:hypothetical protein